MTTNDDRGYAAGLRLVGCPSLIQVQSAAADRSVNARRLQIFFCFGVGAALFSYRRFGMRCHNHETGNAGISCLSWRNNMLLYHLGVRSGHVKGLAGRGGSREHSRPLECRTLIHDACVQPLFAKDFMSQISWRNVFRRRAFCRFGGWSTRKSGLEQACLIDGQH